MSSGPDEKAPLDLTTAPNLDPRFTGSLLDADKKWLAAEVEAALERERTVRTLHFLAGSMSQGRDYTNVIVVAGYAGFFGLWAGMAGDVSAGPRLLSGGLMGFSLLCFIAWELAKMVQLAEGSKIMYRAISGAATMEDLKRQVDLAEDEIRIWETRLYGMWPVSFYPSVVTGIAGAGVLIVAAVTTFLGTLPG